MGICASIQPTKNQEQPLCLISNGPSATIKVIHSADGNLQEFRQPINAGQVLSEHPDTFFLCSSENMFLDIPVPHVPCSEELEPDQIYFIMPLSMADEPLTLHGLCVLTIKASAALKKLAEMRAMDKTVSFSDRDKSKRNGRRNKKVDFQLAMKKNLE